MIVNNKICGTRPEPIVVRDEIDTFGITKSLGSDYVDPNIDQGINRRRRERENLNLNKYYPKR